MNRSPSPNPLERAFAKAIDAIDHERELRAQKISFRTRIVRTKKRGLEFVVTQLERTTDVGAK